MVSITYLPTTNHAICLCSQYSIMWSRRQAPCCPSQCRHICMSKISTSLDQRLAVGFARQARPASIKAYRGVDGWLERRCWTDIRKLFTRQEGIPLALGSTSISSTTEASTQHISREAGRVTQHVLVWCICVECFKTSSVFLQPRGLPC